MTEFSGDQERGGQPDYGAPPVPPAVPPPVAGYPPAQGDYAAPPPAYQEPPAQGGYAAPPPADQSTTAFPPAAGNRPGGFDPANLQNFDPKTVNPLDWGIIAAGVLAFIFSLFAFYTYSVSISIAGLSNTSRSTSVSGWHGFFGWFGALLALIGALLLAAQLIAKVSLPFPIRTVVLGLFGVAALCLLLALVVVPGYAGSAGSSLFGIHVNKGHGFGYWICLLAVLVGTGLSVKRFLDTGGKLPSRA